MGGIKSLRAIGHHLRSIGTFEATDAELGCLALTSTKKGPPNESPPEPYENGIPVASLSPLAHDSVTES
jgi:hypothetical protein